MECEIQLAGSHTRLLGLVLKVDFVSINLTWHAFKGGRVVELLTLVSLWEASP